MRSAQLPVKVALAMTSVLAYWLVLQLVAVLETVAGMPEPGRWVHHVVGVLFGALVMAPYALRPHRRWRIVALCVASAAIYYLAILFVTDGAPGIDATASFVLSGSGAALLVGLAVAVMAPAKPTWRMIPFLIAAGALGGLTFEIDWTSDSLMLVGHGLWPVLVCLALAFSFRDISA